MSFQYGICGLLAATRRVFASAGSVDAGSKLTALGWMRPYQTSPNLGNHFYSSKSGDGELNFVPIYKFPYIVPATVVCRLKLYQTSVTVGMVSVSVLMHHAGLATVTQCQSALAISCLACTVLYIMGGFFRRLVGIMYLNERGDILKISHLTFTGRRRDVLVAVDDVVPFADACDRAVQVYYPLKFYSRGDHFHYIVRYGGILRPDLFSSVFGEEVMRTVKYTQKN